MAHGSVKKRNWMILMTCCMTVFLWSCSHKPEPKPTWGFGTGGIKVSYSADKLLNAFDEKPHTLLLTVYQLSDPNMFNKLSKYEDGLKKLLEAKGDDPSVMGAEKFFVEPGESKTIVLNRAEKARWVGLVAGYYNLVPGKVSRVFKIPYTVKTKGLIRRKHVAEIETLRMNLILGQHSIQEKKTK